MAYRLKSRVLQIPFGFRYNQPEIKWESVKVVGKFPSWERLVTALIAARAANPAQREKHEWSLDVETVAAEVDAYNAKLCVDAGHLKYVTTGSRGGPALPKAQAPSLRERNELAAVAGRVEKIWSGIRTLNDWIDSSDPAVPPDQSSARAAVCATCPKNGKGDFTTWFTQPAAAVIRRQIQRLEHRKLSTPSDGQIQVCEVCLCPLRLKVHTPIKYIEAHLGAAVLDDLRRVPHCWIIAELDRSAAMAALAPS